MARNDARSSAIMAAGTLVSRILGFVKTILLTVAIGSLSTVGDVFETANTLPNLIYVLVAGGVFNAVLVPQIIKAVKHKTAAHDTSPNSSPSPSPQSTHHPHHRRLRLTIISIMGSGWSPEQRQLGFIFALWCLPQIFFYYSTRSSDRSSTPKTHSAPICGRPYSTTSSPSCRCSSSSSSSAHRPPTPTPSTP